MKEKEKDSPWESRAMIVTSRPSLRTQTHLSQTCELSKLDTCGAAAKGVGVPMLEERSWVGIQEAGKPPNGICGTVAAVMVVPARHLALVLITTHVWGNAQDGLMDVAVAEATAPIAWAVPDLVVRLQFKAFVTECWLARCGPLVRVVEGDIVFIRRALSSSDCWHATATDGGTGGRLRIDIVKDASGEPHMYETMTGLEQGVVVHSDVLFQGLEACAERGTPSGLRTESHDFCCDTGIVYGVDVSVHKLFQAGLGVQHVKVVVPYELVIV